MTRSRDKVRAGVQEVLAALTENERKLLSEVFKVETENLHLRKPHVKEELVRKVRQVIS